MASVYRRIPNVGPSGTQDVDVVSSVLPTGAATEATLSDVVANTTKGIVEQILDADDLVISYAWLDFGTADQRISVITYTSASVGESATKTFAYTLDSGSYRLDSATLAVV